jgi:hypothetical protein
MMLRQFNQTHSPPKSLPKVTLLFQCNKFTWGILIFFFTRRRFPGQFCNLQQLILGRTNNTLIKKLKFANVTKKDYEYGFASHTKNVLQYSHTHTHTTVAVLHTGKSKGEIVVPKHAM